MRKMVIIILMMSFQLFAFDILEAKFTKSLNQLNNSFELSHSTNLEECNDPDAVIMTQLLRMMMDVFICGKMNVTVKAI